MSSSTVLTLGVLTVAYATVSGRVERSPVTAPIAFTAAGFLAGPHLLDLVDAPLHSEGFVTLAELALTVLLFTEASRLELPPPSCAVAACRCACWVSACL